MSARSIVAGIVWSLVLCGLVASEQPPSPADPLSFPGRPLPRRPRLQTWPALCTADAIWQLAIEVPLPRNDAETAALGYRADSAGSVSWPWLEQRFRLPDDGSQTVALLTTVPDRPGRFAVALTLAGSRHRLPVTVLAVGTARLPPVRWQNGLTRTADGIPVVLALASEKREDWLPLWSRLPMAQGPPVLVGDDLRALGRSPFAGLLARSVDTTGHPRGDSRLLPWLAGLSAPLPSIIVWSPGDDPLRDGRRWRDEELWLQAIRQRCQALGERPRLLLVLPPLPVEQGLREAAEQRRHNLRASALHAGWEVMDAASLVGEPAQANRIAAGLWAAHPVAGASRALADRLAQALRDPGSLATATVTTSARVIGPDERLWVRVRLDGDLACGAATVSIDDGPDHGFDLQADGSQAVWWSTEAVSGRRSLVVRAAGAQRRWAVQVFDADEEPPGQLSKSTLPVLVSEHPAVVPPSGDVHGRGVLWLGAVEDHIDANLADMPVLRGEVAGDNAWRPWPRVDLIVWNPGPQSAVAHSEHRLIDWITWRAAGVEGRPRLALLLPAPTHEPGDHQRRMILRNRAFAAGWLVIALTDGGSPKTAAMLHDLLTDPVTASRLGLRLRPTAGSILYPGDHWTAVIEQRGPIIDGSAVMLDAGGEQRFQMHDDGVPRAYAAGAAEPGRHAVAVRLAGRMVDLALRVVDIADGWPPGTAIDGQIYDDAGVVLLPWRHPRQDAAGRRWWALRSSVSDGPLLYWGHSDEPLRQHSGVWTVPVDYPAPALLHEMGQRQPRGILWTPCLETQSLTDLERTLEIIPWRLHQLGTRAWMVIHLPRSDDPRLQHLRRHAVFHGWQVRTIQ